MAEKFWEKVKNFRFKGALILTVLFIGLLVFVLVFEKNREVKESEEGLNTFTVWDLPKDDVKKVVFNYSGEKLVLNKQDNGSWKGKKESVKDDKKSTDYFKVDSTKLDPVLDELIKIEASDKIEKPNLKDYGLEGPKLSAFLVLKDNKEKKLFIGDKNPDGSQFYAKVDGEDYVFLIPTSLKARIETKDSDLK